jgi:hypothetical protein
MPSRARRQWIVRAGLRTVLASALALGIMAGSNIVRPAAASAGCDLLNTIPTSLTDAITVPNVSLDAGDKVSVTASAPTVGSPTSVEIALSGVGVVAGTLFPGTATYSAPTAFVGTFIFTVNNGQATLAISCAGAPPPATPPTEAPTKPPTEAPTAMPTVMETPTVIETPAPAATEVPPATEPTSTVPTRPISELPGTGGGPESRSGQSGLWLLIALFAVIGLGISGLLARRAR